MAARPRPRRSHRKLFLSALAAKFDGTAWKLFGDVISASGSLIAGMVRNAEWSVTLAVCRRGAV
jgi:hypothetical protein